MGKEFEKEKARELTPTEKRRLERFESICADMEQKGYRKVDLTIGIVWANVMTFIIAIPIIAVGIILFVVCNPGVAPLITWKWGLKVLFVVMLVLVLVHELIHAVTWSFFAENRLKDVELGFMKQYLTPYATCLTPLKKPGYITGALMPMTVLGLIPLIISIVIGSPFLLYLSIVMMICAGGDMIIAWKLLTYRSKAKEIMIYDHPTQAGSVIFEKD